MELVGEDGLAAQTLNITAEEENGMVTGEFQISENVITIQSADADTNGIIILGARRRQVPNVAVATYSPWPSGKVTPTASPCCQ